MQPLESSTAVTPGRPRGLAWLALFALLAVEALAALVRLLLIPADPKNQVLLGYSASRLAVMALLLAAALGALYLFAHFWRAPALRERWLDRFAARSGWFSLAVGLALATVVLPWAVLVYLRSAGLPSLHTRLSPALVFLALAGVQFLAVLLVTAFGLHPARLASDRPLLRLSAAVLAVFVLLWVLVAITGLGLVPDALGWGIPGVPLLFLQALLLAGVGGLLLVYLGLRRPAASLLPGETAAGRPWKLDLSIAAVIWLAAVLIWMAQPLVLRSYFAPEVRAPNYEIYPFSDAGFYEFTAQSVVIGEGFQHGEIVPRPLFILVLALLNALGGTSYPTLVFLQTLILAAFPMVLYLLGKSLHSRAAGILIAFLAIFREVNSIAATPLTTVSNSKLLLSDFPTALAIALFTLAVLRWLRDPLRPRWQPLAVGGGLGLLMLIRTQSALLAPFILLLALPLYWPKRVRWLEACALFALGLVLTVTPWLWRNYQLTGQLVFDQLTQTVPLAERFSLDGAPPARLPDENDGQYTARLMTSVRQFILQHPGVVAKFASAHFLNNEIHTLLALPTLPRFDNLDDSLAVKTPFWENWAGRLEPGGAVLVLFNLALIAVGLAAAWKRWRWVGLVPLVIHLAYSASNAAARNSGWRYMLPADWVGYFYYGLGVIQALLWAFALFGRQVPPVPADNRAAPASPAGPFPLTAAALAALAFFLAGALLPLSEVVIPRRFPEQSSTEILQEVLPMAQSLQTRWSAAALERFIQQPGALVVKGRALYPRYYKAGEGEPTNEWKAYIPRDFPRLAFLVLNQDKWNVNLRVDQVPKYFPNASTVILIGCREKTGVDPILVAILGDKPTVYTRPNAGPTCPLEPMR